jgi:mono/diheme cytochrome c family protein
MRWGLLVAIGAIAFAVAGLFLAFSQIRLSAIRPPGRIVEYLRLEITRAAIRRRAAREEIPQPPADRQTSMSLSSGKAVYDSDCAVCHGPDGHEPTAIGRAMLPATTALDSPQVQSYSDLELYSIVRDGVRFTGMPGFASVESGERIWNAVDYLRSLR